MALAWTLGIFFRLGLAGAGTVCSGTESSIMESGRLDWNRGMGSPKRKLSFGAHSVRVLDFSLAWTNSASSRIVGYFMVKRPGTENSIVSFVPAGSSCPYRLTEHGPNQDSQVANVPAG